MPLRRTAGAGALALALLAAGCSTSAPPVRSRSLSPLGDSLRKVAVAPFAVREAPAGARPQAAPGDGALVSRVVGEALAAQGRAVVPAGDLERLLPAGAAPPDPAEAAFTAAREFGATSVMLGEVLRFRERDAAAGAARGASVAFELALYDAPSAQKLWSARFDETQQPLSSNVFDRPSYPGRGTRWLSARELARWGAETAVAPLAQRP